MSNKIVTVVLRYKIWSKWNFSVITLLIIRQVKLGGIGKVLLKTRSLGAFRTPLLILSS